MRMPLCDWCYGNHHPRFVCRPQVVAMIEARDHARNREIAERKAKEAERKAKEARKAEERRYIDWTMGWLIRGVFASGLGALLAVSAVDHGLPLMMAAVPGGVAGVGVAITLFVLSMGLEPEATPWGRWLWRRVGEVAQ